MENIVRMTTMQTLRVAERLTSADLHGYSVRVCTGQGVDSKDGRVKTWVKFDFGDRAGWTEPLWTENVFS